MEEIKTGLFRAEDLVPVEETAEETFARAMKWLDHARSTKDEQLLHLVGHILDRWMERLSLDLGHGQVKITRTYEKVAQVH